MTSSRHLRVLCLQGYHGSGALLRRQMAPLAAAGFTSTMPQHAGLFRRKLTLPPVHVTGRSDPVVPMRDSLLLADRFADPLIIEHRGGHVIPAATAVTASIADFLAGFCRKDIGALKPGALRGGR